MGIRDLFKRGKTKKVVDPWGKKTSKSTKTKTLQTTRPKTSWKTHKIHIPGLRTAKRVIAAILLAINFFIAQTALTSATQTQPLYWIFFLNALILLDYLWKTRKRAIEQLEWGNA